MSSQIFHHRIKIIEKKTSTFFDSVAQRQDQKHEQKSPQKINKTATGPNSIADKNTEETELDAGRRPKDQSGGLNESSSGRSRIRQAERLARRPRLSGTNSGGALLLGENTERGTEIPGAEEIGA
jgi:hypothetical protein